MYESIALKLREYPKKWLVTGAAGFIGSNLIERLLLLNQKVIGLDNFITGYPKNLSLVKDNIGEKVWENLTFLEGDICDLQTCQNACQGVDYVLHQAALGSVPRSINDPITTNRVNIDGFLNVLVAARDCNIKRFVYAASSSTYGDSELLPKHEDTIGNPLSPYAVTKYVNELYAEVFSRTYGVSTIGLRYFNIFGQRQSPEGAYAAVIPQWFEGLINNTPVNINGDGTTSRDFCYIENCVQANILAACCDNPAAENTVYNIAAGQQTSLSDLFKIIRAQVATRLPEVVHQEPTYRDFRKGDVKHSLADISKAEKFLGYHPVYSVEEGLKEVTKWYIANLKKD